MRGGRDWPWRPRPRRLLELSVAALLVLAAAFAVMTRLGAAAETRVLARGIVAAVPAANTLSVRTAPGKIVRVRLIGLRAADGCFSARGRAAARTLAFHGRVTVSADTRVRARSGRIVNGYARIGRSDLGARLVARGAATVTTRTPFGRRFARYPIYLEAQSAAQHNRAGVWGCDVPVQPPPPAQAKADLALTQSVQPNPGHALDVVVYNASVENEGPSLAANARLTVTVPSSATSVGLSDAAGCTRSGDAVVCALGDLPVDSSAQRSIDLKFPSAGTATVTGMASTTTDDPAGSNDSATTAMTILPATSPNPSPSTDLALVQTAVPNPVDAGGKVTYTVTVDNQGAADAAAVQVTITLPASASALDLSGAAGCASPAAGTVTCALGTETAGVAVTRQFTVTLSANGVFSAAVKSTTRDVDPTNDSGSTTVTVQTAPPAGDPVIAAAGDIACDPSDANYNAGRGTAKGCQQAATSDVLVTLRKNVNLKAVLAVGDNQYECGGKSAYAVSFGATWGRVKDLVRPVPGNHEYQVKNGTGCDSGGKAAGYYAYFGAAAHASTDGWYSFDVGTWHVIALNSNCAAIGGCQAGSAEEKWLKADLARDTSKCTLAFWHHPRFSSGKNVLNDPTAYVPFWQDLYNSGADVVIVGHDHHYERFRVQDPAGNFDVAKGIREFVVGTGGRNYGVFETPLANSQVRGNAYGVLTLTLHPASYDWKFISVAGETFTDSGSTPCH